MTFDEGVLRIMLRLARRREPADLEAVVVRSGASRAAVRASLQRLHIRGWVDHRANQPPRLTLVGFALAVAMLPSRVEFGAPDVLRPPRAA